MHLNANLLKAATIACQIVAREHLEARGLTVDEGVLKVLVYYCWRLMLNPNQARWPTSIDRTDFLVILGGVITSYLESVWPRKANGARYRVNERALKGSPHIFLRMFWSFNRTIEDNQGFSKHCIVPLYSFQQG
jgi:hypothetical protein